MSCDPTWEVCDTPAADPAPVDTTAAPADDSAAPEDDATTSSSQMPLIYWSTALWLNIAAGLTYNAFTSWASDAVAAKVTNNTAWTTSYVEGAAPMSNNINYAQLQGSLNSGIVFLGLLNKFLGGNGGLVNMIWYRYAQLSLLWPLINIGYAFNAENGYKTCGDLTATQFDSTTTSVDQYVSCNDGTDALFGDSGTTAAKVNSDPHKTWFYLNTISNVLMFGVTFLAVGAIGDAFKAAKVCKDDDGNVIDCPEDDSAAADADSSDAAADDSTDASATDSAPAEDVWWL